MTAAPAFYGDNRPKTGRGRTTTGVVRVPDAESWPCPERPGPHWLRNYGTQTRCVGCRQTWADIDAAIRAAVGWVGRAS